MVTFTSEFSGSSVSLLEGNELGKGEFGKVYTLIDDQQKDSLLVCKEVDLGAPLGPVTSSMTKRERLLFTINEIKILRKIGLLAGYAREGDLFFIVMKKVDGIPGNSFNHADKDRCLYNALRDLHRKNIAHLDCHFGNFLVSETDSTAPKAQTIDFNISEEATFTNVSLDIAMFFERQNKRSVEQYIHFYVSDMIKHAKENKAATCQQIFLIGALTLSAIYGVPALAITHMMAREFISALLMRQLSKEISSKGFEYFTYHALSSQIHDRRVLANIVHVLNIVKSSLSIYLMYSDLSCRWLQGGGASVIGKIASQDNTWKSIFFDLTPEMRLHLGLMYYPISRIIENLTRLTEEFLLPECVLKKKTDLLFQHHPSLYAKYTWATLKNSWFPVDNALNDKIKPAPGV